VPARQLQQRTAPPCEALLAAGVHPVLARVYAARNLLDPAQLTLRLDRLDFIALLTQQVELKDLTSQERASVDGSLLTLRTFGGLFDEFAFWFPIVTP